MLMGRGNQNCGDKGGEDMEVMGRNGQGKARLIK